MRRVAVWIVGMTLVAGGCGGEASDEHRPEKVGDEAFWMLVERSREAAGNDPEAQADALEQSLSDLDPKDILAFDRIFARRLNESYRWDLWAAAYIVNGGCSDDCFDYFRAWLISRGKTAFERGLENPESVGDLVSPDGVPEAESFRYAAANAYEAATGREPPGPAVKRKAQPTGTEWDEDSVDDLFPALAKRFR